ncbi:Ribosomal RNA large subunit methyltransferase K/L [Acaryochloris thomasi RCC1774]|uniref:Ribosomal RNA large subunit methyltransferase K/L n=1 Tax=Acaryochloris thomasi RCC1774 TaxID=1764569 RepID=A0A2W1JXC1_9CYAN|nr:THUMP domain-containing protein [Acaryochloris thomasi]PZD72987.1 Ribosomal RNA large subunit methyltransferase K/L [Acaryochloris thomasi RCC1774]
MNTYFATVARGLESLAAEELETLGASSVEPGFCGVSFIGDSALLYKVNLWARLPFRILQSLKEFPCQDAQDLYRGIQTLDWQTYLTPEQTLAVKATGKNRQLNHTHFTALQVKNAIVDQQQQRFDERSSVDPQTPDVLINVHIHRDLCTVSLDSSGSSLHRRGYRPAVGAAPLKESLAAALIHMSQWQPDQPFMDPLCGSGTLPLEAGLISINQAPGLYRESFGFETWPNFESELWHSLRQNAVDSCRETLDAVVVGCDRNPTVIQQARQNAANCGIETQIELYQQELSLVEAPSDHGVLLCNPPYGERLGKDIDLGAFYKLLGNVLKQQFKGWTAFVLSGNKELSRTIGLKSSQRFSVHNGSLPCQLMKYELY